MKISLYIWQRNLDIIVEPRVILIEKEIKFVFFLKPFKEN